MESLKIKWRTSLVKVFSKLTIVVCAAGGGPGSVDMHYLRKSAAEALPWLVYVSFLSTYPLFI